MKIIEGPCNFSATLKRAVIFGPFPKCSSTETTSTFASLSAPIASAIEVFPVPGGPKRRKPDDGVPYIAPCSLGFR
tara:strand:+ start:336 stop:563 length:228 start_codon:yes stop_codon:yes gene_type:complete